MLTSFLSRFPELQLDLVYGDRPVDLLAEHIDAAIMLTPLGDSSLRVVKLDEARRILCAAPAYLSAHGEPTHPRELTRRVPRLQRPRSGLDVAPGGPRGSSVREGEAHMARPLSVSDSAPS